MPETAPITILFPAPLRPYSGGASQLSVWAPSVRAALQQLEGTHPALYACICDETGAVRRHLGLFVNSTHVSYREGVDTPLVPGDTLTILPAVSGG
jgi:molybdopterin synthase sulfur carrier subunit